MDAGLWTLESRISAFPSALPGYAGLTFSGRFAIVPVTAVTLLVQGRPLLFIPSACTTHFYVQKVRSR